MAISTYSELKTAIADWLDRADLSGNAADFITLAEARLNRLLRPVETETTLTGTVASRYVSISALSVIEQVALFIADTAGGDETALTYKAPGMFAFDDTAGEPGIYSVDGTNLVFERPLDAAYSFRFRYQGRYALSDVAPTNTLLTLHPDVYFAAAIVWSGLYIGDQSRVATYKALLDEFIAETKNTLSQTRRGALSVDPALLSNGGYFVGAALE